MSRPSPPSPAKLIIGFFTPEKSLGVQAVTELERQFGPVDYLSKWLAFDYTDYYAPELGAVLFRRVMSFKRLIQQAQLANIKTQTNEMEQAWSVSGKRQINIDPGYLLPSRFVLATGKNFAHRIYIGHSIYADLTLLYENGQFQTLPWTYPDYADPELQAVLEQIRDKYMDAAGHKSKMAP